ncbi:family 16 glycosylhydrolase [Aquimarina sp. RZ0]|uniref:family 16 glycosylhydrolase n=1 Tax=Aquimarina sp. RZ0 TaxID=2607730 RepID=UPI0011F3ECE8|nr:family 16 glycosylhydrolase [Aquimarina sp. RZ0]KAA1245584.1 hypothetical protein F0000_11585 [Aquimarina sp. RZ0]
MDIAESIGGDFNKPWASNFRTKMNFNTHYRYVDCNGAPEVFYSAGNNAVEGNGQQADANLVGSESWEDYHTYGCYWKDTKTFDFYVDTNFAGTVIGRIDVVDTPFSEPMGINMVTETYDFVRPIQVMPNLLIMLLIPHITTGYVRTDLFLYLIRNQIAQAAVMVLLIYLMEIWKMAI